MCRPGSGAVVNQPPPVTPRPSPRSWVSSSYVFSVAWVSRYVPSLVRTSPSPPPLPLALVVLTGFVNTVFSAFWSLILCHHLFVRRLFSVAVAGQSWAPRLVKIPQRVAHKTGLVYPVSRLTFGSGCSSKYVFDGGPLGTPRKGLGAAAGLPPALKVCSVVVECEC